MDEKLLCRIQIGGALLIVIAYFLPWASILSTFGSIQVRGVYVDYAWILLVLVIGHLIAQYAEPNREVLGIPEHWVPYIGLYRRITPFLIVGFLAWYGSHFSFGVSRTSTGLSASLFGKELASMLKGGLDFGYWIGACGAIILLVSEGLLIKRAPRYLSLALIVIVAIIGVTFGFTKFGKPSQVTSPAPQIFSQSPSTSSNISGADKTDQSEPVMDFDASPYVQVKSITGQLYRKNIHESRFSDEVVITPIFKNVGTKAIVGLRGRLSVLDGFGNVVYTFLFKDSDKILPSADTKGRGGYSFEDNQFIHDQPYDKIAPLIIGDTAKYSTKIIQIAFEDGTILPQTKEAK